MNKPEAVILTRWIRANFPSQPLDEYTSEALHDMLAAFPLADAKAAVGNIAHTGTAFCAPAAVAAEVRRIRSARIAKHEADLQPPSGLSDAEYRDWLRDARRRIADGDPSAIASLGGER